MCLNYRGKIIITLHVLGHFIAARLLGVGVTECALGYGRTLYSRVIGGTVYSVRFLPLWCRVRLHGDLSPLFAFGKRIGPNPTTSDSQARSDTKGSFARFVDKSLPVQIAVAVAGPLFSLVCAWVLAFSWHMLVGVRHIIPTDSITIGRIANNSPAYHAGLREGDRIFTIGGKKVVAFEEIADIVQSSGGAGTRIRDRASRRKNRFEYAISAHA